MDFLSHLPLILFFVAGFGLLIAEAFMPGFGVAGTLGAILELLAVWYAWTRLGTVPALILTAVILVLIGVTVALSYRSIMKGRLSRGALVLQDAESADASSALDALRALNGKEGVAVSSLRPAGQIELDGQRVNASTNGEFLARGTRVLVTGAEGDHVLVRPA